MWKLYTDGASSSDGSSAGLMLNSPEGKECTYTLRFKFDTKNDEAEYEELLAGLRIAEEMEIKSLTIFVDSHLIVNQVKGLFEARQPAIKQYLERTKEVLKGFDTYSIEHIQRNKNKKADERSKLASMTFEHLTKEVLVEVLANRFNEEPRSMVVKVTKQGYYWPAMYKDAAKVRSVSNNHLEELKAFYKRYLRRFLQRIKKNAIFLPYQGSRGNNESHQEAASSKSTRMGR
ncbi:reverse transcriptase domain-containing protein [Tanacetum coccineum]